MRQAVGFHRKAITPVKIHTRLLPRSGQKLNVQVSMISDRLQILQPFQPWDGNDANNILIQIKTMSKTTTGHISMASSLFQYRKHLNNISNNIPIKAINASKREVNKNKNFTTGEFDAVRAVTRDYKKKSFKWVVISDLNYSERDLSRTYSIRALTAWRPHHRHMKLCPHPETNLEK